MKVLKVKLNDRSLKCGICHSRIANSSKIYNSELLFIPFCYNCEKKFDKEEKKVILTLLESYGGYFGIFSREDYSLEKDLNFIIKKNPKINSKEDLDGINSKLLHNALLHGITIHEYISKLELLI
ncbi:MAG: hypothetical protein JXA99_15250 [Candidatus Lokiarchaeota archaeon]|nr:hypothetical protein [Candidatus Lokiarchaeota archaeon]